MTKYNMWSVKLSNTQLNKLKSWIKNGTEVTLDLSSNLIRNSKDKVNFPRKLLLTDTQVSKIRKAFADGLSANLKFRQLSCLRLYNYVTSWHTYFILSSVVRNEQI